MKIKKILIGFGNHGTDDADLWETLLIADKNNLHRLGQHELKIHIKKEVNHEDKEME